MPEDDEADESAERLYAVPPEEFMPLRDELVKAARAGGDPAAAKAIAALRKPTLAASVVNRLALSDPSVLERLTDLGDRLRRAHEDLDAVVLRELTTERRTTVAEVTRAAFEHSGRDDPPTGLRDEVSATFDAAVADPEVAQRLGRLVRSEHFSGFGVAAGTSPGLTLVQGGRGTRAKPPAKKAAPPEPTVAPATARRLTRRRDKARAEFESADDRFTAAETAQQRESERVRTLTDEIAELQRELDEAKRAVEQARREVRTTRTRRRDARSALDRAERAAERGSD